MQKPFLNIRRTTVLWAMVAVLVWSGPGPSRGDEQPGGSDAKKDQKDEPKPRQRPNPPGSRQFVKQRQRMVLGQIANTPDRRQTIEDEAVLEAMSNVPRHVFVPEKVRHASYDDTALPIGHGQTISQPYIVALMTEHLKLTSKSKVLEIGTGSGYQAAVLAHLTEHIYTVEIVKPLAERTAKVFKKQEYDEIKHRRGDGYFGWKEHAPYDAIIVTCAAGHLPPPLWEQLMPGGRIVIPIGDPRQVQRLVLLEKSEEGKRRSETITYVRFVPLMRESDQRP